MSKKKRKIDQTSAAFPKGYWKSFVESLSHAEPNDKSSSEELQRHRLLLAFQKHVAKLHLPNDSLLETWLWVRAATKSKNQVLAQKEALKLEKQLVEGPKVVPDYLDTLLLQVQMEQVRQGIRRADPLPLAKAISKARSTLEALAESIRAELNCAAASLPKCIEDKADVPDSPEKWPQTILWETLDKALRGDRAARTNAISLFLQNHARLSEPNLTSVYLALNGLLLSDRQAHIPSAAQHFLSFQQACHNAGIIPPALPIDQLCQIIHAAANEGESTWANRLVKEQCMHLDAAASQTAKEFAWGMTAYHFGRCEEAESAFNHLLQSEKSPFLRITIRSQLLQLYFERFSEMDLKLIPSQLKHLRQYLSRKKDLDPMTIERKMLKVKAFEALFRAKEGASLNLRKKYRQKLEFQTSEIPFLRNWEWLTAQLEAMGLKPAIPPASSIAPFPPKAPKERRGGRSR